MNFSTGISSDGTIDNDLREINETHVASLVARAAYRAGIPTCETGRARRLAHRDTRPKHCLHRAIPQSSPIAGGVLSGKYLDGARPPGVVYSVTHVPVLAPRLVPPISEAAQQKLDQAICRFQFPV
jgi:hypothetical protein